MDDWDKFNIDANTGTITSRGTFDREEKSEYFITVNAEDGAPSARPGHTPPNSGNR